MKVVKRCRAKITYRVCRGFPVYNLAQFRCFCAYICGRFGLFFVFAFIFEGDLGYSLQFLMILTLFQGGAVTCVANPACAKLTL